MEHLQIRKRTQLVRQCFDYIEANPELFDSGEVFDAFRQLPDAIELYIQARKPRQVADLVELDRFEEVVLRVAAASEFVLLYK